MSMKIIALCFVKGRVGGRGAAATKASRVSASVSPKRQRRATTPQPAGLSIEDSLQTAGALPSQHEETARRITQDLRAD